MQEAAFAVDDIVELKQVGNVQNTGAAAFDADIDGSTLESVDNFECAHVGVEGFKKCACCRNVRSRHAGAVHFGVAAAHTDAADADTGSGNVNDFAHVGEIGHTLVPVVCRNGNAVGNVCGAAGGSVGTVVVACRNAVNDVVVCHALGNNFNVCIVVVVTGAAEAEVCRSRAVEGSVFHCKNDLCGITVTIGIENFQRHDFDVGKVAVKDGACAVGTVAVVILGVAVVVYKVITRNGSADKIGVIAVVTGVDNGNNDFGKVFNAAGIVEHPLIVVESINIVRTVAPAEEFVHAGFLIRLHDDIGFGILNALYKLKSFGRFARFFGSSVLNNVPVIVAVYMRNGAGVVQLFGALDDDSSVCIGVGIRCFFGIFSGILFGHVVQSAGKSKQIFAALCVIGSGDGPFGKAADGKDEAEAHDEREQQCSSFPEIHSVFLRVMFVDSLRCISCLKRRSKSVRITLSETGTEVKENL